MNEEQLKEIAILAKELGFKPRTLSTSVTFEKFTRVDKGLPVNDTCYYLLLCEIQLWLQKNHCFYVNVIPLRWSNNNIECFTWTIRDFTKKGHFDSGEEYCSYDESLLTGILEGLKLIKNGN